MERWTPLPAPDDFDLPSTLNSGQVFHWTPVGKAWHGIIDTAHTQFRPTKQPGWEFRSSLSTDAIQHYLGLHDDMPGIFASFRPDDTPLQAAIRFCPGLRILRQPAWECLATFITSSLKQIPHIRQISLRLREVYGKNGAYPTPSKLAALGETGLRAMGLGFRAKNLAATAQRIASGEVDFANWPRLSTPKLEAQLLQLPGVGPKIAHCVLLFGYARLEAFPIDVWVERALRRLYFPQKDKLTAKFLTDFAQQQFGPYRGYAQQFLFHHVRLT
jgi:N-glycosylase/DNA lyase